jgi:hypothetical protein
MAVTGWTVAGQSLRTPGWEIVSVDGWDEYPSWRGESVEVANRHGITVNSRRFANSRSLQIPMVVLPYNPSTGAQTLPPEEHLQENIETLLGIFYGSHSLIGITRTMPDLTVRTIQGEVVQAIPIQGGGGRVRELVLQLDCPYPFWHGAAISDLGNSGTFTVTNGGNAPVGDAVFTFSGIATLTHDDTGDEFSITAGANTIVDAGERTIQRASVDVDGDFELGTTGYWIELLPGVNNFTLTGAGTVDVVGFDGWL